MKTLKTNWITISERKEELKRDLEKLEEENDKLREAIATLRIELDDLKIF